MNEKYETVVEIVWLTLVLGGMALGLGAVAYVLIDGQGAGFFRTPLDPIWGVLVATYEFFVIVSGGLGLVAGVGRYLRLPGAGSCRGKGVQVGWLALVTGLATVTIEITSPMRLSLNADLNSAFPHVTAFAALLFALYLGWLVIEYLTLRFAHPRLAFIAGLIGWGLALVAMWQLGRVLGHLEESPPWHDAGFWLRSTFSALILGGAVLPLVPLLGGWLRHTAPPADPCRLVSSLGRLQCWILPAYALYLATTLAFGLGGTTSWAPLLLSGPLAGNFWGIEIAVGLLLPAFLLYWPGRTLRRVAFAGFFAVVGQYFMSYDRVVASQLAPIFAGGFPRMPGIFYFPSPIRGIMVVGAFAFFLFMWTLLEKDFPQDFL